ncbi:MAG: type II secretion system protein F [Salinibacterium sp.]|nr:MAG: type II secretion system protein F [Salinibacterium sp.]
MGVLLGLALAVGVLFSASPLLWPRREPRARNVATTRIQDRLIQAGLDQVSPAMVVVVSALLAVAAAALVFATLAVVALAVAAGVVALLVPAMVISWRARVRRRATRVVWPDVVDQLVSAVRSGLALPDSVVTLAHVGPLATRHAFESFEAEYRATGNFSVCLDALKVRLADPVADRILETLRMSREVGGSELTTVLRNLSAYLRQESAIRSEVEARQSWVMNAAKLGVAAPWVVLLLLATRPEAAGAYNSPGGATLIILGLIVSFFAYRLMIGLGRLPDERRWFA